MLNFKSFFPLISALKLPLLKYCIISILTTIIEAFAILSIFPFVQLINNREYINNDNYILIFKELTGIKDYESILISFGLLTVILFFIVTLLRIYNLYFQSKFNHFYSHKFSIEVLKFYLLKEYPWFANQDVSKLIKDTLEETSIVIMKVFATLGNFICSLLNCIIFISLFIFFAGVKVFFSVLILLIPYVVFSKIISSKLKNYGQFRFIENQKRYQILKNIYSGIKEIKSGNLEFKFFNLFKNINLNLSLVMRKISILAQLPRYILEFAFIFISILTILFIVKSYDFTFGFIVSSISVVLLSILRLIPQIQIVFKSFTDLQFYLPSLDQFNKNHYSFYSNIRKRELNNNHNSIFFNNELKLENINLEINQKKILTNIQFIITKNSMIGIFGDSGSGKTSLAEIIIGLKSFDQGKIFVDGKIIDSKNIEYRNMFSYVPQNSFLINDTIENNITFYGNQKSKKNISISELVKFVKLEKFIDELDNGVSTTTGDDGKLISGGEKQRISIGRAIFANRQIVIFDEATSGLDDNTQEKLLDNIKSIKNMTKIIISHDAKVLKKCDEVYKLENRKIKKIIDY